MITYCKLEDIKPIASLAFKYQKELGFLRDVVIKEHILSGEIVAYRNPEIIGFCLYHFVRKGYITVYDICVDDRFRGQGIGRQLLSAVRRIAPVKLKITQDNIANKFYEKVGGRLLTVEHGRKRLLNVWVFNKE
jgi:ribosomal protein S18 acetylase RimI-like enzyme